MRTLIIVAVTGILLAVPVPAVAATLPPFCTQHQLKVHAYEKGACRVWFRNATGGGQVYGRHS